MDNKSTSKNNDNYIYEEDFLDDKYNNYDKKHKGFTLIELLAVIIVIGLLFGIGYITYIKVVNDIKEDTVIISEEMILDAAKSYSIEYRKADSWNEYSNNFCISIDNLIDYGYFKNVDSEASINMFREKYYVAIDLRNGVYNSKLIEKNVADKICTYYDYSSTLQSSNDVININAEDENSPIGDLEYDIDQVGDKNYLVNINGSFSITKEQHVKKHPIYILYILDTSGSMITNGREKKKYIPAVNAIKTMSDEFIDNYNESAYVGLVLIGDKIKYKREFLNSKLENSDFDKKTGDSNFSGAIDMASGIIENKIKEVSDDSQFFVFLLYDGEPTHYSYIKTKEFENSEKIIEYNPTKNSNLYFNNLNNYYDQLSSGKCSVSNCIKHIVSSSNNLKSISDRITFITIGYEMKKNVDGLVPIGSSSDFCKGSESNCYYNSNSDNVNNLFEDFYKNISSIVRTTDAKRARIELIINENAFKYVGKSDDLVKYIDLTSYNANDIIDIDYNYDYEFIISDDFLDNKVKDNGEINVPLIDKILVTLEYADAEDRNIYVTDIPKLKLSLSKTSIIN